MITSLGLKFKGTKRYTMKSLSPSLTHSLGMVALDRASVKTSEEGTTEQESNRELASHAKTPGKSVPRQKEQPV